MRRPDVVRVVDPDAAGGEIRDRPLDAPVGVGVPGCERLEDEVLVAEEPRGGVVEVGPYRVLVLGGPRRRIGRIDTGGATRVDGADGRLFEDAPFDPGHRELLPGEDSTVDIRGLEFGSAHVEKSEFVPPGLAPEPARVVERDLFALEQPDPSAEVGVGPIARRETEDPRPLEEEIAPFGETKRETREVETPLIDLRLSEVGVHAHPRPQARCDVVVDVETDVAWVRGLVSLFRHIFPIRHRVGNRLESYPLRHSLEAGEPPCVYGLAEALVAPIPAPEDLLVFAADRALEVDPPAVRGRVEVQRAEGNLDLQRPPVRTDVRLNLPDSVPRTAPTPATSTPSTTSAASATSATSADEGVAHYAHGIGLEEVAGATVLEGVENPHETVVGAEEAIPPLLEHHNPLGIVIEDGSDVERILVVDDPDLGPLRWRPAFHRLLLGEVRDGDGPLPRFLVKPPIHVDGGTALQAKRDEIDGLGVPLPVDLALGR